jgi:Xaa-Pro aminopeptidase
VEEFRADREHPTEALQRAGARPAEPSADQGRHFVAAPAFAAHGFEAAYYTGHQLGTTVNEDPRLVPYDDTPIEPNMVFAVELGVDAGAGATRARADKVALVTADGPQVLSRFS